MAKAGRGQIVVAFELVLGINVSSLYGYVPMGTHLFVFCPPGPEDLENVVLAILVGIIDFDLVNLWYQSRATLRSASSLSLTANPENGLLL